MMFALGVIVGILLTAIAGLIGALMARTGQTPQRLSTLVLDPLVPSQGYAVEPDTSHEFAESLTSNE